MPKKKPESSPFMKPYRIAPALAIPLKISRPVLRVELVSILWGYIKKNKLQDPVNLRMVNFDEALAEVFGVPSLSMFALAGALNPFLLEVVDLDPDVPLELLSSTDSPGYSEIDDSALRSD